MVTENGIATDNDERRMAHIRGPLEGVLATIKDGIDVIGYQYWSLPANFEWASGFRPTFGLLSWDPRTFARIPKPSAHWYGNIARSNALPA